MVIENFTDPGKIKQFIITPERLDAGVFGTKLVLNVMVWDDKKNPKKDGTDTCYPVIAK